MPLQVRWFARYNSRVTVMQVGSVTASISTVQNTCPLLVRLAYSRQKYVRLRALL